MSVHRVALVVPTFAEAGRAVLRGVTSFAERARTWELHCTPLPIVDATVLRLALHADGVILWVPNIDVTEVVRKARVPVVGVHYHGRLRIARVCNDNEAIVTLAVEHMMKQGFRNFAFFGVIGRSFSNQRYQHFRKIMSAKRSAYKSHFASDIESHAFGWHKHDETLVKWLRALPKPIAVLCANDGLGLQLLLNVPHAGVRVPDEVAVVGIDNDELICRMTTPQMSSIDTAGESIGFQAATLMDLAMKGGKIRKRHVLVKPRGLIVRQSSDVLAVNDPNVAAAVRFIRENTLKHLSVGDVSKQIPVARRTLERGFRSWLGHSIHEEISESRIRLARQLLIDTDMPITEITRQCGFSNRTHLNAVFRRRTGHSPAAYRREFRKPR